jgi:DNA-binding phage protein
MGETMKVHFDVEVPELGAAIKEAVGDRDIAEVVYKTGIGQTQLYNLMAERSGTTMETLRTLDAVLGSNLMDQVFDILETV